MQYYVLKGCGLELSDASVMFFDRTYVRHGAINVHGLFTSESVLEQVLEMQDKIKEMIPKYHALVQGDEPMIAMGDQCSSPYNCEFCDYCSALNPVVEEPQASLSKTVIFDKQMLQEDLKTLKYPICHLDFETIMPGVPMFDNSSPYQQITFQFSMHIKESPTSEVQHYEYLAPNDLSVDPRIGLIKEMIFYTKKAKTVLMYSPFERIQINKMIQAFPEYTDDLEKLVDKLWDLMPIFRSKHCYTEDMGRSFSIKVVLPALCPELSYAVLDINNGLAASSSFLELYYSNDKEYIHETRANLLKYCCLDTFAMVRFLEVLEQAVKI